MNHTPPIPAVSPPDPEVENETNRSGVMPDIPLPNPRQTLTDVAPIKNAVEVL